MGQLIDPRLGYRTGRVKDAQALTPEAVSRGRLLADLGVRIGEDEADVEVRILLSDQPVLGPVFGHEAAFLTSLGEKSPPGALHREVGREFPRSGLLAALNFPAYVAVLNSR